MNSTTTSDLSDADERLAVLLRRLEDWESKGTQVDEELTRLFAHVHVILHDCLPPSSVDHAGTEDTETQEDIQYLDDCVRVYFAPHKPSEHEVSRKKDQNRASLKEGMLLRTLQETFGSGMLLMVPKDVMVKLSVRPKHRKAITLTILSRKLAGPERQTFFHNLNLRRQEFAADLALANLLYAGTGRPLL